MIIRKEDDLVLLDEKDARAEKYRGRMEKSQLKVFLEMQNGNRSEIEMRKVQPLGKNAATG